MADNYVPMPVFMRTDSSGANAKGSAPPGVGLPGMRMLKPHEAVEMIDRAHAEAAKACKSLLFTYINNLTSDPENPKFRKVGVRNPYFVSQIKNVPGGMEFLFACGFVLSADHDWLVYGAPDLSAAKAGREALLRTAARPASERKEEKERREREKEIAKERERIEKEAQKAEREREKLREKEQRGAKPPAIDPASFRPVAPPKEGPASPRKAPPLVASSPILLAGGGPAALTPKVSGAFFGASLKSVMERQKEKYPTLRVPRFFLLATRFLLQHGLTFEGIFRISARVENINHMKERIDATHPDYEFTNTEEVPTVTGVLTAFLRELHNPLLPADFYHELLSLVTEKQAQFPEVQLALLTKIIANIPGHNQALLSELFWFLTIVAQNSDYNKMTKDNLSRLMGPNIIWIKHTPQMDITKMHLDSERVTGLVSLLLNNYRVVFQDICPPLAWKEEIGLHGRIFAGHKKPVVFLTVTQMICQATPRLVWLLDSSNAVRVWDVVNYVFVKEFILDRGAVLNMLGVEGRVWLCSSRSLTICHPETGALLKEHATAAFYAERSGKAVVVALWDGIRTFDAETLEPSGPFYTTPPDAKQMRLVGTRLWTGASKSVCVFDTETRSLLREHRPHTRPVVSLCELCDNRLLSGASDGSLAVFSLDTLEPVHRIESPNVNIRLIGAVSPPGTEFLFTASQDGTLRQYNTRTWQVLRDITSPPGEGLSAIALITRSPADIAPFLCVGFNDIFLSLYRIPDKPRGTTAQPALLRQVSAPVIGRSTPPATPSPSGSSVVIMPTPALPPASPSLAPPDTPPTPPSPTPSPVPGLALSSQPALSPSGSYLNRSPRSLAMQAEAGALILPAEGFRVENGKKSPLPGLELNVYDFSDHYRTNFAGKKQVHFVGYMSADESAPTVVSILTQPESGKFPEPVYKGIVRTKTSGQDMFFIPSSDLAKVHIPKGREKEDSLVVRLHTHLEAVFFHGSRLSVVQTADNSGPEADLLEFERNDPERSNCFAIGVVYVKDGQSSCKEFWDTEHGSAGFERFLSLLGERVRLKGWSKFRGGLDVTNDTKGAWSIYTKFQDKWEIMFHVSTLLPFQASDPLKLLRARQIQNDVVVLLYIEGNQPYAPETMPTNVSHVFAVVRPVQEEGETKYRLAVVSKDNVNAFRPDLPVMCFKHDDQFRNFLLTKLLNGQIAARKSGLQMMFTRPRAAMLEDLIATYRPTKQRSGTAGAALELLRSLSPQRNRSGTNDKDKEERQRAEEASAPVSSSPAGTRHGLGALFHRQPTSSPVQRAAAAADTPSGLGKPPRREISPQVAQSISRVEELLQKVDTV